MSKEQDEAYGALEEVILSEFVCLNRGEGLTMPWEDMSYEDRVQFVDKNYYKIVGGMSTDDVLSQIDDIVSAVKCSFNLTIRKGGGYGEL
jgi:hypothetical protein